MSSGLSKWLGAGGWRLGFFAVPNKLKNILEMIKILSSESLSAVSAPIQYAAITAHKNNHDDYINLICDEMLPSIAKEKIAEYCDVFCEEGYFSVLECIKILKIAYALPETNQKSVLVHP